MVLKKKIFSEEGRQFAEEFKLKEGISGFLTKKQRI